MSTATVEQLAQVEAPIKAVVLRLRRWCTSAVTGPVVLEEGPAPLERIAAFKLAFEAIVAVIAALEVERGQSPRALRADGNLGASLAAASTAAHDGLQLIAQHERQLAG